MLWQKKNNNEKKKGMGIVTRVKPNTLKCLFYFYSFAKIKKYKYNLT